MSLNCRGFWTRRYYSYQLVDNFDNYNVSLAASFLSTHALGDSYLASTRLFMEVIAHCIQLSNGQQKHDLGSNSITVISLDS